MKVILVSDVHLHRWTYGSHTTEYGFNSRLVQQYEYLISLGELAKANGIHNIICLGDLFHTNQTIHTETLMAAVCSVQELNWKYGVEFDCLVGNHDMASKNGEIHALYMLRSQGKVIDKPTTFELGGRKISALPYTENVETLTSFLKSSEELVLLHQGININGNQGSAWTLNEIFTPDMVPDHVKAVFTGHYHKPASKDKITIVGSPMQHNWSDCDGIPRGCIVLDLDTLQFTRVANIYNPTFKKIDWTSQENVDNSFVRVYNCPKDKVDSVRDNLLEKGAISVEIDLALDTVEKETTGIKSNIVTMEGALTEFEEVASEPRRILGRQLREGLYEAPKISS